MRKLGLVSLAAVSMATLLLTACGGGVVTEKKTDETTTAASEEAKETATGGNETFTIAIKGDTGNTINALTVDDRSGLMVMKALYSPLYFIHPDGKVDYIIADSMKADAEGKVWTLKLKEGLKWSDNEPITVDDVIYTIDEKNKVNQNLFINNEAVKMEKVDDLTMKFTISVPSSSFFELMSAENFILPKHYYEKKGSFDVNMLEEKPVVDGPYMLDEYMTGQHIKFKKNPSYVMGEASIDNVVYKVVESDDTATLALQNGELDGWIALPDLLEPYKDSKDFTTYTYSEGRVAFMMLNTASPKMQDKEYRKGILHAVDRNEILQAAYSNPEYYKVSYSFLPEISEYYDANVEKFDRDVELAKKLTANGPKDLKIGYGSADEIERQALTIQAELKEVGINVELNKLDNAAYSKMYLDKTNTDYDIILGGYVMGIDPNAFAPLFSSDKDDYIRYNNPEIDKLWVEADKEQDKTKRKEMYSEIQKKIQDEAVFYPFGSNLRILVVNNKIGGVEDASLVPIYTFGDLSKLK